MPSTPLAPVSYEAIKAVRTLASAAAFPAAQRTPEAATQTCQYGVPLMLSSGFLAEFSSSGANIVYGVSSEHAHNLAVAGVGTDYNQGSPPNQPSGITTPIGSAPVDGNLGNYFANGQTVFSIALKAGQVFTQALLINPATLYGLVKDATSGFWYLDNTVTTGNGAVALLLGVDSASPNTVAGGSRVFFMFGETKRFFQ